jgi:hypothetical protein
MPKVSAPVLRVREFWLHRCVAAERVGRESWPPSAVSSTHFSPS